MNWSKLALDAPTIIGIAMRTAEAFKKKADGGPSGPEKEAAVIVAAKDSLPIIEHATGVDINEGSFDEVLASYIRSRVALKNFITKRSPVPEGVLVPAGS